MWMGLGTTPRRGDVSEGRRADAGHPRGGGAPRRPAKLTAPHFVRDSVRTVELCRLEQRRRAVRRDDTLDEQPEGPEPSKAPLWMRRMRPRFVAPFVREGALGALHARRASWVKAAAPRRAPRTVKLPGREPGRGIETTRVPAREVDPIRDAVEIAWAAGLFAGEGYCGAIRRGKHKTVHLAVKMLDERSVQRFAALFGRSLRKMPLAYDKTRWCFEASADGRPAEEMLALMWPYLADTAKGDQIRAACHEVGVFAWVDGSATEPRPTRLGGNQWTGKRHSDETKAKMSAAHKARWARKRGDHG